MMDFNPDLPPMGKFVHKHKHILNLDKKTSSVINPNNVFVSYRGNKTIKEMISPSKLKPLDVDPTTTSNERVCGSFQCVDSCKLCRMHLESPPNFTSFHTDKVFDFRHSLSCNDPWVIYLADDMICKRSYVGSTEVSLYSRWTNHKSHIRNSHGTCGLTKHFLHDRVNHDFERKRNKLSVFDEILSKQVRVTLIDQLQGEDRTTRKLKDREAYWQSQLRTFIEYGGLNERDARKEKSKKSYFSAP